MRCNCARWLWGTIPVLLLTWLVVMHEGERFEADLKLRAQLALQEANLSWAAPVFSGREAVLLGQATDETERRAAADLVASVWGVRAVEDRSGLVDVAANYVWTAGLRSNNRLRISGFVPSDQRRREIIGLARATFPGREVEDRMKLARGAPEQKQWLGGIGFALNQLSKLKSGAYIELDGAALTIDGEAEDVAAYRTVVSAIADQRPRGITLKREKVMPPAVRPYTWGATFRTQELKLTGHVPGDRQRRMLLEEATRTFPNTVVVDNMVPASGEPAGWEAAARALFSALARLEEGSLELRDEQISLSGIAEHEAAAELARQWLKSALPASFKLGEQIKVRIPLEQATKGLAAGQSGRSTETAALGPPDGCQATLKGSASRGSILFAFASADLEPATAPALDQLTILIKGCASARIEIAGHADAEGSETFNQELSERRARAVAHYLTRAGIDTSRVAIAGYGATQPIAANDTASNRARNRRIEFAVKVD